MKKLLDYSDTIKLVFSAIQNVSDKLADQEFLNMISEIHDVLAKYNR